MALSCALLCGLSEAFLPQQVPIRIDCGAESGSTDAQGLVWQADGYYANGTAQAVQPMYSAGGSLAAVDSTLRAWTAGDSCYHVPVAPGRYLVRLSFAYNNFDDNYYNLLTSNKLPTVGVSINGFYVEHVGMSMINITGYYTDYVAYSEADAKSAPDEIVGAAEAAAGGAEVEWVHVCLEPEQGSPYVNSLQVLPVDTDSYYAATTGSQVALSNWVRINAGGGALGPEVAGDPGYRTWNPDQPASASFDPWTLVQTSGDIDIPESLAPLNLPTTLFQTARKAGNPLKSTGYNFTGIFPVDPSHRFMVVLYFAEIEDNVQAGDRVMDIWVNGETVNKLDVIANAGAPNTALVVHLSVPLGGDVSSPVGQWIGVLLRPSAAAMQPPIISGVEVYEIIPLRVAPAMTDPDGSAAVAVRVDCGGHYNYTDSFGLTWSADYGYSSGAPSIVLAPENEFEHARSIRYYPEEGSNCYDVPVPAGRYLVRMFFDYGNYDGLNEVPKFSVAVEGTLLVTVVPAAPGGYEDVVATVNDGAASVCVLADLNSPHPTLISSIEVLEIDGKAYLPTELTASKTLGGGSGAAAILYDHVRVNSGGVVFGEGLTADLERGHRQWLGDTNMSLFGVACSPACFQVALPDSVEPSGADEAPEFVPPTLFRTARTASRLGPSSASSVTYTFSNVRAGATVLVYLHLMEVSPGARVGSRVFSVFANGLLVDKLSNVDVMASVGRYAAKTESFLLTLGAEETGVEVELRSERGATLGPAVSGVELYVVLPRSPAVPAATLSAMHALRDSMKVPESAHWQGDPCAPVEWYGVNCTNVTAPNNPSVVVARQVVSISVNDVGFNGTIPEAIGNLTSLTLLSLSGNGLIGSIPQSITALKNLVSLDLSKNQLNGSIPDGLTSMPSLHLLLLNDNLLMGVPEGLVPAPPGIAVNLQGNPYLCGADGYPSCNSIVFPPPPGMGGVTAVPLDTPPPSSGGSSTLSVGAIVGIVVGVLAVLAAIVILALVLWRRQQQRKQLERAESQQYALGTPTKHTPGCMGFHEKGYCEVVPEDSAPYL